MKPHGFVDLDFAKLDIARAARRGFPEIIYAPRKKPVYLKKIIAELKKHGNMVVVSRLEGRIARLLQKKFPALKYFSEARLAFLGAQPKEKRGYVLVLAAGTSDISVAEEAAVFLEFTGNRVERIYDVGVAGLHRLEPFKEKIKKAQVIVVVAGMEAALLSVVAGLVRSPVIGVPTSVGYGASFEGLAALLGMLNACPLGTTVVNIDNGLGAGYFANLINK
ncbi:MAG: nickel pincer cofactor biosynthesis protein LarB [Candidatus Omnitrophota bacterium]|nr:nickel pincer cofactor biosynthesis protein LarB [Candidatus Omnitrophota bacterium]